MPAKKYPQYPKPKNYVNLRYRVSNEKLIGFIHYGLSLILKTNPISAEDFDLIIKELERLKQLKLIRAEYKAANLRIKARRKLQRANNPNYPRSPRVDPTDNRDDEG